MESEPPRHVGDQDSVSLLSREDVLALGLSAMAAPDLEDGASLEAKPTLISAVFSYGCQVWFVVGRDFLLPAPSAKRGSPAYAAELLKMMSDRFPRRKEQPPIRRVADVLHDLSDLCREINNGGSLDAVGFAALLAGMSLGRFGQVGVNDEQYKLASSTLEKNQKAKADRRDTLQEKRLLYEGRLLSFALEEVRADPRISNAAIQRRWRRQEKLPETVTSDNEAKTLARFRGDGRLPLRQTGKNTSNPESHD